MAETVAQVKKPAIQYKGLKPSERNADNFYGELQTGRERKDGRSAARYYVHPDSKKRVYVKPNGRIASKFGKAKEEDTA